MMRATTKALRNSPAVLGVGLCLFATAAMAEVKISQVVIDGKPQDVTASSAYPASDAKSLRLSSAARNIQFQFTEADSQGQQTARLRYKLEGYDAAWRDLPVRMRLLVQFHNRNHRGVAGGEFYLEGETPGWRGTVENSDFVKRREEILVPELAASAQIIFLSYGGESGMGVVAIDAVRVQCQLQGGGLQVFDLTLRGANLSTPLGIPDNWMRDSGSRPELAQLATRPTPTPHPVLLINDDDPNHYGNWSLMPRNEIPVRPGNRLTIEWETAHSIGRSGPGEADYTQLKPGRYWFRVAAAKANGELTGQEVSLPVVVVSPFYQRVDFWLVTLALAGGIAAWVRYVWVQKKMQRQLAEIEQQQALERERARIARDLHDDIGAGLSEIAMQSDWVRRDLAENSTPDTLRRIQRVCDSAVELTRSVDAMVWAVTPANDTLDRFANYLMQSTRQFLDATNLRVRFDFPAKLPAITLPGKIRHCLFLAVREALNNVTKHAHADLVRLELRVEADTLRLVIEDNGCGFASEKLVEDGTHEGLNTMRRRLQEIGGKFQLNSRPGSGTRVEFRAPLKS